MIHPSVLRNRDPILGVLRRILPESGTVLELASGTGAHAAWFTQHLPGLRWQPSEGSPLRLPAIQAHRQATPSTGFLPPILLDAAHPEAWPDGPFDAVVNINMAHISPWTATVGVIAGAGRVLADGGALVFYGPFMVDGQHTAPSNAQFDRSLRAQDAQWGVRDVGALCGRAAQVGLRLDAQVSMPANNFTLVFRRR